MNQNLQFHVYQDTVHIIVVTPVFAVWAQLETGKMRPSGVKHQWPKPWYMKWPKHKSSNSVNCTLGASPSQYSFGPIAIILLVQCQENSKGHKLCCINYERFGKSESSWEDRQTRITGEMNHNFQGVFCWDGQNIVSILIYRMWNWSLQLLIYNLGLYL